MKSIESLGAEVMKSFYRTGEAYEITGGDDIVGFSPFETPKRAEMLNARIADLENKVLARAKAKYGPEGFAATITAAQLPEFKSDKKLYNEFVAWKNNWDAISNAWDFRFTGEDEVTKHETQILEWKDRFAKQGLYSAAIQPSTPPEPSTPGGSAQKQVSSKGLTTTNKVLLAVGGAGVCGLAVWAFSRRRA